MLLAIDLGLRCGLALYGRDGRLVRFSSRRFASITTLKRAAWSVLAELPPLEVVVVEGDRALGEVWLKAVEKRGAEGRFVRPEQWRGALLYAREQRSVVRFYTAVFCVNFLGEQGQQFNRAAAPPVDPCEVQRLVAILDLLLMSS